jgi:hypothetical protein
MPPDPSTQELLIRATELLRRNGETVEGHGDVITIDDVLEAAGRWRSRRDDAAIIVVGGVDQREQLADVVHQLTRRRCGRTEGGLAELRPLAAGAARTPWDRGSLSWSIDLTNAPPGPSYAAQFGVALRQWELAIPFFRFRAVAGTGADLRVRFGGSEVDDDFGEAGGVIGSAEFPMIGDIRFDESEPWTDAGFFSVALHEIGHALGLTHSSSPSSVMYPFDFGVTTLDRETVDAARRIYGWRRQQRLGDRSSSDGPALAAITSTPNVTASWRSTMAWKGAGGDSRIFVASSRDGMNWGPQRALDGIRSSHGPALVGFRPSRDHTALLMAWKGEGDDQRIFWSRSFDHETFEPHHRFDDRTSAARPALAWFDGQVVMAWRGQDGDERIWWSRFDGNSWSPQAAIAGRTTSHSPALAVAGNRLCMLWKASGDDQRIHHAFLDRGPDAIWSAGLQVTYVDNNTDGAVAHSVRTSHHPVAAARGDALMLAYKGQTGDDALWMMQWQAGEWSGPTQIPDVLSATGPGIAVIGGAVVLAWRAQGPDETLHCSRLG